MEIFESRPNTCYICTQHFIHYEKVKPCPKRDFPPKEIEIITAHPACRRLIKKRDKLLNDLVEIEYDIFAKMV